MTKKLKTKLLRKHFIKMLKTAYKNNLKERSVFEIIRDNCRMAIMVSNYYNLLAVNTRKSDFRIGGIPHGKGYSVQTTEPIK